LLFDAVGKKPEYVTLGEEWSAEQLLNPRVSRKRFLKQLADQGRTIQSFSGNRVDYAARSFRSGGPMIVVHDYERSATLQ
jgi:DNA-directed RNA polymerase beta' subunit